MTQSRTGSVSATNNKKASSDGRTKCPHATTGGMMGSLMTIKVSMARTVQWCLAIAEDGTTSPAKKVNITCVKNHKNKRQAAQKLLNSVGFNPIISARSTLSESSRSRRTSKVRSLERTSSRVSRPERTK